MLGREDRDDAAVAGRVDDQVERVLAPVGEGDTVALELPDVGLDRQVAVAEGVEELRVEDGVRLEQAVVGGRQAEAPDVAHQEAQQPLEDGLFDPAGELRALVAEDVGRHAEQVLRDEPVAAAQADAGAARGGADVHGDVASRVATAHHQHAPAPHLLRRPVGRGVDLLAVEAPRQLGPLGRPLQAGGDDHARVAPALARRQLDDPFRPFARSGRTLFTVGRRTRPSRGRPCRSAYARRYASTWRWLG